MYLRIQLVVSSNSLGVMMFVSDATEAAQYALLKTEKKTDMDQQRETWVSRKCAAPTQLCIYRLSAGQI